MCSGGVAGMMGHIDLIKEELSQGGISKPSMCSVGGGGIMQSHIG